MDGDTTAVQSATLRRAAYALAVLVLFASMVDLFMNRLLFRAGPEVLSHIRFDFTAVAAFGRVTFTFEQLSLFLIVGFAVVIMLRGREALPRLVALVMIPQLVCAALLYFPLPVPLEWSLTTMLLSATWVEVLGLVWFRWSRLGATPMLGRIGGKAFFLALALAFSLPFYYRASVLVGAVSGVALPFSIEAYAGAIYLLMATSAASFFYALSVPSGPYRTTLRAFLLATVLPSLIVAPIIYGLFASFFMGQILSLVVAMSTDITLSYTQLRLLVMFWWFLLSAFFLLLLKGRGSGNRFLVQSAIGLILILSTSFLFNYPPYLLLGTVGVLLLTFPLFGGDSAPS